MLSGSFECDMLEECVGQKYAVGSQTLVSQGMLKHVAFHGNIYTPMKSTLPTKSCRALL